MPGSSVSDVARNRRRALIGGAVGVCLILLLLILLVLRTPAPDFGYTALPKLGLQLPVADLIDVKEKQETINGKPRFVATVTTGNPACTISVTEWFPDEVSKTLDEVVAAVLIEPPGGFADPPRILRRETTIEGGFYLEYTVGYRSMLSNRKQPTSWVGRYHRIIDGRIFSCETGQSSTDESFDCVSPACAALRSLRSKQVQPANDTTEGTADTFECAVPGAVIPDDVERRCVPIEGVARGTPEALVTIVEFADFQCPFSARAVPTLHGLFKQYPNKLRLFFRHNPLQVHPEARSASEAALAASAQGRFWAMHDKLFANQQELGRRNLRRYAREMGLAMTKFNDALDGHAFDAKLANDLAVATAVGGRMGTPTFMINGRVLVGARSEEEFERIIDDEIRRAQKLVSNGTPAKSVYAALMKGSNARGQGPSPLPVQANAPSQGFSLPPTPSGTQLPLTDLEGAAEANHRGGALSEERRYDEAVQAFDEAVRLDPRMTGAWANRAHALLKLGRLDEAATSANKALELSTVPKTRAVAHLALGFIAVKRGKIREAEAAYQEALAERPDYPAAQDALGTLTVNQHPTSPLLAAVRVALSGQALTDPLIVGLTRPELLILAAATSARHGLPIDDPSVASFYYTTRLPLGTQLKEDPATSRARLTATDQVNEQNVRRRLMAEGRSSGKPK